MHLLTLLFLACQRPSDSIKTPSESSASTDSNDSNSTHDSDGIDILPSGLHGEAPAENLPLPEFSATAMNGQPRSQPDLLGHPTVIWFYPAANTSG